MNFPNFCLYSSVQCNRDALHSEDYHRTTIWPVALHKGIGSLQTEFKSAFREAALVSYLQAESENESLVPENALQVCLNRIKRYPTLKRVAMVNLDLNKDLQHSVKTR